MTKAEMITTIENYNSWVELIENAKAEAENLKDILKAELEAKGVEELSAGQYIVRNTPSLKSVFDTKRFKEAGFEYLYKEFQRETMTHRFSIAS